MIKKWINWHRKRTKYRTCVYVVLGHALLLLLVFLIFFLPDFFTETPKVITVTVISADDIPSPNNSEKAPSQPKAEPTPPQPVKKIEPPKPKPIQPPKPVSVPVPEVKPIPKPQEKKVEPKPQPKKYLDSSQILKSDNVIKKTETKVVKKIEATDISANLRKNLSNIKFTSSSANATQADMDYFAQVRDELYDLWEQPTSREVGGASPSVTVRLTISSYGSVTSASIVRQSGISAMDISVKELLQRLKTLPKPPKGGMTFEAVLVLED